MNQIKNLNEISSREEVQIWVKYFSYQIIKKELPKKSNVDPLFAIFKFIQEENYDQKMIQEIVQKNKNPNDTLLELSKFLNFNQLISISAIEMTRISISTEKTEMHKNFLSDFNVIVMRTFIKIAFNLENELSNLEQNKPLTSFTDIIWTYAKYFIVYFGSCDSQYYHDFQVISIRFFQTIINKIPILMDKMQNKNFITLVWDLLPDVSNDIGKEAGTKFTLSFKYILSLILSFVSHFSIKENSTKILIINHYIMNADVSYNKLSEEQKLLVHTINSKILRLFENDKNLPNENDIYTVGFTCFSFECKNNIRYLNLTASGIAHFIRWIVNINSIDKIKIPALEEKYFYDFNQEKENPVTLSFDEFKEKRFYDFHAVEEMKSLFSLREFKDFYNSIKIIKNNSVKYSEKTFSYFSKEFCNCLKTVEEEPNYHIFLAIITFILSYMKIDKTEDLQENIWSLFIDSFVFSLDINKIDENEFSKSFIQQIRTLLLNFLISKSSENRKASKFILNALSDIIKNSNETLLYNFMPLFETLFIEKKEQFIEDFAESGCIDTLSKAFHNHENDEFSSRIFNLLQTMTSVSLSSLINSLSFKDLFSDLIIKPEYKSIIITMIQEKLQHLINPNSKAESSELTATLDFICYIFEITSKYFQNTDKLDEDDENLINSKKTYLDVSCTLFDVIFDFVNSSKAQELYEKLTNPLLSLVSLLPGFTKSLDICKKVLLLYKKSFLSFPQLIKILKPRSSKININMINSIRQIDSVDQEFLDLMLQILFGSNTDVKYPSFGIVQNKEFITIFISSMKGKQQEQLVLNFVIYLQMESRLNAMLLCEAQTVPVCLNRLVESTDGDDEIVKTLLDLVMNLFEQFPSATILLQLMPTIKQFMSKGQSFWPLIILKFLKKLSTTEENQKYPAYINLYSPESIIIGPNLDQHSLDEEWTFITTIRFSSQSPKGTPFPLLYLTGLKDSSIQLMIKNNALAITQKTPKKAANLQQILFNFDPERWYFLEISFSSSNITFYCDKKSIGSVQRTEVQFDSNIQVLIGSFNDPKITKKSIVDIRDTFIMKGIYVDIVGPDTAIGSISSSTSICTFKISTSTKNDTIDVISPYGQTATFIGYYVPRSVEFSSLFDVEGIWTSFFVLYFGAGNASEANNSENPMVLLPKIMMNIIKRNPRSESTLTQIEGFNIISQHLISLDQIEENVCIQFSKLYKSLKTQESKQSCILSLYMNGDIFAKLTTEAITFCALFIQDIYKNEKSLFSKVLKNPSVTHFYEQISIVYKNLQNNETNNTKEISLLKYLFDMTHSIISESNTKEHYQLLMNLLASPEINEEITIENIQLFERFIKSNDQVFANTVNNYDCGKLFYNLLSSKTEEINRLSLPCLYLISKNNSKSEENEKKMMKLFFDISNQLTINHILEKENLFIDSYDYLFSINQGNGNDSIRKHLDSLNEFVNSEIIDITLPEFFILFVAFSFSANKETVIKLVNHIIDKMNQSPELFSPLAKIPYWSFYGFILCYNAFFTKESNTELQNPLKEQQELKPKYNNEEEEQIKLEQNTSENEKEELNLSSQKMNKINSNYELMLSKFSIFFNSVLLKSIHDVDIQTIKKALHDLDIISYFINYDFSNQKNLILLLVFKELPNHSKNPEIVSDLILSAFSLIFVDNIKRFSSEIQLNDDIFNITLFDKIEKEMKQIQKSDLQIYVKLNEENTMVYKDLALSLIDLMSEWFNKSREIPLSKHFTAISIFSYVISLLIITSNEDYSTLLDKYYSIFSHVKYLADTEDEHQSLGIFLTFIKRKESLENDKIKLLIEKFYCFSDEDDSFELQKFYFENNLLENITKLYLNNLI